MSELVKKYTDGRTDTNLCDIVERVNEPFLSELLQPLFLGLKCLLHSVYCSSYHLQLVQCLSGFLFTVH